MIHRNSCCKSCVRFPKWKTTENKKLEASSALAILHYHQLMLNSCRPWHWLLELLSTSHLRFGLGPGHIPCRKMMLPDAAAIAWGYKWFIVFLSVWEVLSSTIIQYIHIYMCHIKWYLISNDISYNLMYHHASCIIYIVYHIIFIFHFANHSCNVGKKIKKLRFGMVYITHLRWFWGWF